MHAMSSAQVAHDSLEVPRAVVLLNLVGRIDKGMVIAMSLALAALVGFAD